MGLDMYIVSIPKVALRSFEEMLVIANQVENDQPYDSLAEPYVFQKGTHFRWQSIMHDVMYWRKVNAIHGWFVEHVQDGIDECQTVQVTKDDVERLLSLVDAVLADRELAPDLLPIASGFFFGSDEYDEYYFNDLEETQSALDNILKTFNFEGEYLAYRSSW